MDPGQSLKEIQAAIKGTKTRMVEVNNAQAEREASIDSLERQIVALKEEREQGVRTLEALTTKLKKQENKRGKIEALMAAMAALMEDDSDAEDAGEDVGGGEAEAEDAGEGEVEAEGEAEAEAEPEANVVADEEEEEEEEDDPDLDEAVEYSLDGETFFYNKTSLNV